jgi:hypothetical protein
MTKVAGRLFAHGSGVVGPLGWSLLLERGMPNLLLNR